MNKQKLLALIPPWKDFSWPPRNLNVRDNLEERNHSRSFGIHLWPPPSNTAPQSDHVIMIKIEITLQMTKGHFLKPFWIYTLSVHPRVCYKEIQSGDQRHLSLWGVNFRLWYFIHSYQDPGYCHRSRP